MNRESSKLNNPSTTFYKKVVLGKNRGIAAIEVIVASALVLIIISSTSFALNLFIRLHATALETTKADYLLAEGIEAARYLRDISYGERLAVTTPGNTYYLAYSTNAWSVTTTPQYIDSKYLRTVQFNNAYRDGSDNLATSGTLDADTKKVVVSVSWPGRGATTTRSMTSYIFNIFAN